MVRKMIRNSNILVTGGMGFIGFPIVKRLIPDNEHIIVLDNAPADAIIDSENVTFHNEDMGNVDFASLLEDIDYVFHLGAKINVCDSFKNPYEYLSVNSNSTLKLLEGARKNDVKKIIFSSSAAVYGDINGLISEDMTPQPKSPYGLSKFVSELYLKNYFENYGIDYASLRYFNVYGYKGKNNEISDVVTQFIRNMIADNPPVINGDGNQTRDFIFIDDVVNANMHFAKYGFNGEVNIGSGKETSILELFNILKDITNFKQEPIHEKRVESEIINSKADIELMSSLGFEISNPSLRDNLIKVIDSYNL